MAQTYLLTFQSIRLQLVDLQCYKYYLFLFICKDFHNSFIQWLNNMNSEIRCWQGLEKKGI